MLPGTLPKVTFGKVPCRSYRLLSWWCLVARISHSSSFFVFFSSIRLCCFFQWKTNAIKDLVKILWPYWSHFRVRSVIWLGEKCVTFIEEAYLEQRCLTLGPQKTWRTSENMGKTFKFNKYWRFISVIAVKGLGISEFWGHYFRE